MFKCPLAFAAATALSITMSTAQAADLETLGEPPVIEVSDSGTGPYVAGRIAAAFTADTAFGLTAPAGGGTFTSITNDYDTFGLAGSLAVGTALQVMGIGIRTELEVGATSAHIDSHTLEALNATFTDANAFGKTKVIYGLANLAVDIPTSTRFTPYVTAGVGLGRVNFDNHGVALAAATVGLPAGNVTAMNDTANGIAWQVGAGTSVDLTDTLALELGYEYFNVSNIKITGALGDNTTLGFSQHKAEMGFRLSF
jgi:opacity protein-like surface antigen